MGYIHPGRFSIQLIFPGGELPDQLFFVTSSMTVPVLRRASTELIGNDPVVQMLVGPLWAALDHCGLIVALFVPGTSTPCPALEPGSRLRVVVDSTMGSSSVLSSDGDGVILRALSFFDARSLPRLAKRHRSESVGSKGDGKSAPDLSFDGSPSTRSDDSGCHFPTLIPDDEVEENKREEVAVVAVTRRERAMLMSTFR
jgi:hypothetical protein